jgi:hypothetical protein
VLRGSRGRIAWGLPSTGRGKAVHPSYRQLLAVNGRYRELYDKEYRFESNINPGEDLTREADRQVGAAARAQALDKWRTDKDDERRL